MSQTRTRTRPITEAARALLAPRPRWIPPRATVLERAVGVGSGTAAAFASPVLQGLLGRALSPLATDPTRFEPTPEEMGDPGWFGPDSVAWRVHADPAMLVAGIAAFALQSLHPLAMAGVAEHSSFSTDFLGRTRRTADFVQCVVYGSSLEADRACRTVRRIHDHVVGTAPDGRPYAANDPGLLDWVHIAEYATIVSANRRFAVRPMSLEEMDRYVGEVARVGTEVGVPDPPTDWAGLVSSLERHRHDLAFAEYAARGIAFLDDPPIIPGPAMPLWRPLWNGAVASLPPIARELLRVRMPSPLELSATRTLLRLLGSAGNVPPRMTAARRRLGLLT